MCLHSHETNNDTSIIFHGQKAKARWWYLLDDVGDAFAAGQVHDLFEGDKGGLGTRLLAVLTPQLRRFKLKIFACLNSEVLSF